MIKILWFLAGAYVLVVIGMTLFQRKIMYYPHTDLASPEHYGIHGFSAQTLKTDDGVELSYWYAAPKPGKPTILYLHGNAGHLGFRSEFYLHANQLGYGVMALSYRGFGASQGSPSERGFYADAKAALKSLHEKYNTDDAAIIVYGESIGTGVAVELARTHTFRMVALQAPFTSVVKRAAQIYYWLPVKWVLWDKFDSLAKAAELTSPVLMMIGEDDRLILPEDSEILFKAIPTPKKLVRFSGTSHNNFSAEATLKAVSEFDENQR